MTDYAELIRQSVSMPQILALYGFGSPRGHRMPCPLHNGVKPNFTFNNERFKCYVCGAHGTVIDFVMQLYGLSFMDAMKRIDQDCKLGLKIGEHCSDEQDAQRRRELDERIAARRARQSERQRLYDEYHDALDRWIEMDKVVQNEAPQLPWDEPSDRYAHAVKWISAAADVVDETERNIWEFEHEALWRHHETIRL